MILRSSFHKKVSLLILEKCGERWGPFHITQKKSILIKNDLFFPVNIFLGFFLLRVFMERFLLPISGKFAFFYQCMRQRNYCIGVNFRNRALNIITGFQVF